MLTNYSLSCSLAAGEGKVGRLSFDFEVTAAGMRHYRAAHYMTKKLLNRLQQYPIKLCRTSEIITASKQQFIYTSRMLLSVLTKEDVSCYCKLGAQ